MPSLSPRAIEMLIDLTENKLANLDVSDREDRQTQRALKQAIIELMACRTEQPTMLPPKRAMERPLHAAAF